MDIPGWISIFTRMNSLRSSNLHMTAIFPENFTLVYCLSKFTCMSAIDFSATKISFSKVINVNIHNAECDVFKIYISREGKLLVVEFQKGSDIVDIRARWIIKTTTNILILCGNIISQKRDLKSWWTIIMPCTHSCTKKNASLCISRHFYVSRISESFLCLQLHVLSVGKNYYWHHMRNNNWDC